MVECVEVEATLVTWMDCVIARFESMDAGNHDARPQPNPFVVLDGTANSGCIGPAVGAFDIGESVSSYLFRVALPGVTKDGLVVGMERSGHVCIKGVMPSNGILEKSSSVFQMHVEQICPPGPFKISFTLPGEIDARIVTSTYPSGILEVTVGKRVFPDTTPKMAGIKRPNPYL
ncbi:hypothetical protein EZV62_021050 [Acer yangbiense]|uniref:SHSP domain-containing protein n=1 Tax=Acer yangbiense TaxID=1000413 RepID=A0A5C7H4K9_9ROSI|nr:hypothetical protein EZV62_021050 [Acer yangbiense]